MEIFFNPHKKWAIDLAKKIKKIKLPEDLSVVIGGDGTLFYYKDQLKGRVILIGSEHSYRCQLTYNNWREITDRVKSMAYPVTLLESNHGSAINDIVIHSKDYKVMKITIKLDDKEFEFLGDGIIISTGFGSTGYNYSAGGVELPYYDERIQITPIAPYQRKIGPIIADIDTLEIIFEEGAIIIDGQYKGIHSGILKIKRKKTPWKYFE